MTINPARDELLALAARVRTEEWADELSLALVAAANAGWSWPRAALHACGLIFREDGQPRELRDAARDPLKPGPDGTAPQSVADELAAVRQRAKAASDAYRGQSGDGAA